MQDIQWIVDSWDAATEQVVRYHAGVHAWGDFPNVLAVILPHKINGKQYRMRQIGNDWYFRESGLVFGGWVDPFQPWATDVVGHRLTFSEEGVENQRLYETPSVSDAIPGIMLPEHQWAEYRVTA